MDILSPRIVLTREMTFPDAGRFLEVALNGPKCNTMGNIS